MKQPSSGSSFWCPIAMVAVRTPGLREIVAGGELEALRIVTDRRDDLALERADRGSGEAGVVEPRPLRTRR